MKKRKKPSNVDLPNLDKLYLHSMDVDEFRIDVESFFFFEFTLKKKNSFHFNNFLFLIAKYHSG